MIGIAGTFGIVRMKGWISGYGYNGMVRDDWYGRDIWDSSDDGMDRWVWTCSMVRDDWYGRDIWDS